MISKTGSPVSIYTVISTQWKILKNCMIFYTEKNENQIIKHNIIRSLILSIPAVVIYYPWWERDFF